jgi:putative transposase
VLEVLHAERFWDAAPATVYATLLDEGSYLCSTSTVYRLLRAQGETGDRRRHATHPATVKPELLAARPNQCWSWDITKLAGPAKWTWFYLYVILDIYSRYVVGWMVAAREAAQLAERLLADLGVTKSHSRPHVPDDNPYSESQFKTLKHHPAFPDRFASIQDAAPSARASSAGTTTPTATAGSRCSPPPTSTTAVPADHPEPRRGADTAYQARPERFVRRPPQPPRLPEAVWINKPVDPQEPPQQFPG